eukprot:TRINITY_DN5027_c0_g1_i18.p1 TRINITY_DN5027_c0_g1~~TRINITY_DN5027_c0_g1_i18.p1  ORF type:complete len:172 (+),score=29.08 TRINITY_DN5027_c0_g1_i18:2-517(+)
MIPGGDPDTRGCRGSKLGYIFAHTSPSCALAYISGLQQAAMSPIPNDTFHATKISTMSTNIVGTYTLKSFLIDASTTIEFKQDGKVIHTTSSFEGVSGSTTLEGTWEDTGNGKVQCHYKKKTEYYEVWGEGGMTDAKPLETNGTLEIDSVENSELQGREIRKWTGNRVFIF